MKSIYTPVEIKILEEDSRRKYNLTNIEQIKIAGKRLFEKINKDKPKGRILVTSGPGANGLDAIVVAKHLIENGYDCDLYIPLGESQDSISLIKEYKLKYIKEIKEYNYNVMIDGLFGTAYKYIDNSKYNSIINNLNKKSSIVYSIDIPSGVNGYNGKVINGIKATYTLIVGAYKTGNLLDSARDYENNIELIDIDLDTKISNKHLIEKEDFMCFFPKRLINTNKGTYKKATLIAGSKAFMGASILALQALSSLRLGSGYQELAIPKSLFSVYALRYPELTLKLLNDNDGNVLFCKEQLDEIISSSNVITIGMGLKISEDVYKIIDYISHNYKKTLIIDADGLNSISKYGPSCFENKTCTIILTPHLKEFERMTGISIDCIKEDRISVLEQYAKKYDVNIVLKDSTTIITNGYEFYFNISGNPGLAKGGSGDVLAGIISGVINSLDKTVIEACSFSSFFLGYVAEALAKKIAIESMIASDIVNEIPLLINDFHE